MPARGAGFLFLALPRRRFRPWFSRHPAGRPAAGITRHTFSAPSSRLGLRLKDGPDRRGLGPLACRLTALSASLRTGRADLPCMSPATPSYSLCPPGLDLPGLRWGGKIGFQAHIWIFFLTESQAARGGMCGRGGFVRPTQVPGVHGDIDSDPILSPATICL